MSTGQRKSSPSSSTVVGRSNFLMIAMSLVGSFSTAAGQVNAFSSILIAENSEAICQNGAVVEERAIPGAYSSVCMTLPERIVPLPKFSTRNQKQGKLIIGQQAGGSGQTGKTVWNSGLLLARLLDELVDKLSSHHEYKDFWSSQSIIELGCGTGLGSIAAHRLGAKSVVATDGNPPAVSTTK